MSDNGTLEASIKAAASRGSVAPRRRLPEYAVDGLLPQVAVSPADATEVASILLASSGCEAAVIPWGGGTCMSASGMPSRYDVALDVTRLNRIVEHMAEDLTIVVQAGARVQDLQDHLAHRGQYLPLDPPLPEQATVGGMLASNAGGPWRHSSGWPRDWLLGMKVALADGSVIKMGGRVVKNVAGYDMGKLFTGSFGSLGVIVETAFKVMPLPPARATAIALFASSQVAVRAALALHSRKLRVESLDLLNPEAARSVMPDHVKGGLWCLVVGAAGNRTAVDRTLREMAAICTSEGAAMASLETEQAEMAWRHIRDYGLSTPRGEQTILRIGLLPSQVAPFVQIAGVLAHTGDFALGIDARPGLGSVRCHAPPAAQLPATIDELRREAERFGGRLVVETCPASLKGKIDVWGENSLTLTRRVKEALDAGRTMSPGRFVGGI